MDAASVQKLEAFFASLYAEAHGWVEFRPLHPDGRVAAEHRAFVSTDTPDLVAGYASSLPSGLHAYFGVCPRSHTAKQQTRGTAHHLTSLPALWADIDSKRHGSLALARQALNTYAVKPSAVVYTGHGFHAYWFLETPQPITGSRHGLLQAVLRSLQVDVLGSDDVSDLSRVLRVPFSSNVKDPERPLRTSITDLTDRRYAWEALLEPLLVNGSDEAYVRGNDREGSGLREEAYDGLDNVLASDFIDYCRRKAKTLSEPLWYAMITNLIGFRGGREAIHRLSQPHPSYTAQETNEKIRHALHDAPGPHTYAFIASHGFRSNDLDSGEYAAPASRAFAQDASRGHQTASSHQPP